MINSHPLPIRVGAVLIEIQDATGHSVRLEVEATEMFIGVDHGAGESTSAAVLARSTPTGSFTVETTWRPVPDAFAHPIPPYRWPSADRPGARRARRGVRR